MNKKWILLLILFILGFFIRVIPLQQAHWWDETVYLQMSEVVFSDLNNYDEFYLRPPLLPLVLAASYLFWHNVFMAGIVVALFGSLGIIFIYLIGEGLFNKRVALISAIFFTFLPYFVQSSHWIMSDIPL